MNIIYDTVKTVVIYLILVAIVMNLLGTSSYKKYVAMFTGMLLIFIVITPIMKILNISDDMEYHFEENYFKAEAVDMSTYLDAADEEQNGNIIKGYKEKILQQIKEVLSNRKLTLTDCTIEIDEDISSETFGNILSITVVAKNMEEEEKDGRSNLVEKIHIEKVKIEDNQDTKPVIPGTDSVLELEMKKALAELYDLDIKNIIFEIK